MGEAMSATRIACFYIGVAMWAATVIAVTPMWGSWRWWAVVISGVIGNLAGYFEGSEKGSWSDR
jgi:uncharacterized membrane protein